jgi:hypothetical protein
MEGTNMKRFTMLVIVLLSCVTPASAGAVDDNGPASAPVKDVITDVSMATYKGRTIDLRNGWGTATACLVSSTGTTCFDTEKELDAQLALTAPVLDEAVVSGFRSAAAAVSCASSLRLYSGISYTGSVLAIIDRYTIVNLASLGYSNVTTSFRVGACAVTMWDGTTGNGAVYPGNTSAGAVAASMATGWNDRVSSVYLW